MNVSISRFLLEFCLLELMLSIPFWVLVALAQAGVIPNYQMVNALWSATPAIAVLILVYRRSGAEGVKAILRRCFDYARIKSRKWYLPIFFVWPFIIFVMYEVARWTGQAPPSPQLSWLVPGTFILFFFLVYFEELAWTGYLIDPLQDKYGALNGSLIVGVLWASFHGPVWLAAGWPLEWCAWQWVYVVASRVLFVWMYNNAGRSLFAVALIHPAFGCYFYLWPVSQNMGVPSFYDPRTLALTTVALAAIVTFLWGARTLSRYRYARTS
jgi:hypothetical protein